jgi:hypothetical protein
MISILCITKCVGCPYFSFCNPFIRVHSSAPKIDGRRMVSESSVIILVSCVFVLEIGKELLYDSIAEQLTIF